MQFLPTPYLILKPSLFCLSLLLQPVQSLLLIRPPLPDHGNFPPKFHLSGSLYSLFDSVLLLSRSCCAFFALFLVKLGEVSHTRLNLLFLFLCAGIDSLFEYFDMQKFVFLLFNKREQSLDVIWYKDETMFWITTLIPFCSKIYTNPQVHNTRLIKNVFLWTLWLFTFVCEKQASYKTRAMHTNESRHSGLMCSKL